MYNRIYETLFEGSMVGSGALTFAVWSYVLGKMKPDRRDLEFYLEINPILLGAILGEEPADVGNVVERLCAPDAGSRTLDNGGRRLVKVGTFLYRVVNGAKYNDLSSYEHRRKYQRVKQAEYRKNKKKKKGLVEGNDQEGEAAVAVAETSARPEGPPEAVYDPESGGIDDLH